MENTLQKIKQFLFLSLLTFGWLTASMNSLSAQCTNDTIPPICIAPANITINCSVFDTMTFDINDPSTLNSFFGTPTYSDNCPGGGINYLNVVENLSACNVGSIIRGFNSTDGAGNDSESCFQQITIERGPAEFQLDIPLSTLPGDPVDSLTATFNSCSELAITYNDIVFDFNCDGVADKILRGWTVIDWCDSNPTGGNITIEPLDIDGDGIVGDPYDIEVAQDSMYVLIGGQRGAAIAEYTGNPITYWQVIRVNNVIDGQVTISGNIFSDDNIDCTLDVNESGIPNQVIQLDAFPSNLSYTTVSDSMGNYSFDVCSLDTLFEAHLPLPFNYAGTCGTTFTFDSSVGSLDTVINLPVQLPNCPLLIVDIGTWGLRPCFNSAYMVNYQNYSFETVTDASVEVILDPALDYQDSSLPAQSINGDTLVFQLNTLAPMESGEFLITVFLDCDAPTGQTHCTQATIFPDTLCEPIDPLWSGASVGLRGVCLDDSLEFTLINKGTANMQEVQDYIVIEDVLMMMNNPFQLAFGEESSFRVPANGATWHVSAGQEPFHPGQDMPAVTIEGCGGLNNPGQALSFVQNDANPFVSIDCQQSTNSYDPNDKQVFPAGFGEEHLLEANTDLEYMIRFQNTGTAEAFNVVILDTLSPHIDIQSIQAGVSSHPYVFENLIEGRILRFSFNDINLPDSTTNEPESHGFVKFKAKQLPDVSIGTRIENSAAIYFDFNDPILTNTSFVTIGEDLFDIVNGVTENLLPGIALKVFPNPAHTAAMIQLEGSKGATTQVQLYSVHQQLVRDQTFRGTQTALNVRGLPSGIYILRILVDGELGGTAKLLVH